MQTPQKLSVILFDTAKLRRGNKLKVIKTIISAKLNIKKFISIKSYLRNFKDTIYDYILKINLSCVNIPLKQELVLISRGIRGDIL